MWDHQLIIQMLATTTTTTKIYKLFFLSGNLLETRISNSLWMHETWKFVPTPRNLSNQLQIMAQSQNNVKVLPGWSAMGTGHIYPVNRKDHHHPNVVEQEGVANCIK